MLEEVAAAVRPEALRTQLALMAATDLRDVLPRIRVPTILIRGELDARSPLYRRASVRAARSRGPSGRARGLRPCQPLEQPERFNEAVREFCRAH